MNTSALSNGSVATRCNRGVGGGRRGQVCVRWEEGTLLTFKIVPLHRVVKFWSRPEMNDVSCSAPDLVVATAVA